MRIDSSFNGERLKEARIYRGYSVAELAQKLELQRQTVSMYENNKLRNPTHSTIVNMSKVLGFPKRFFLERDSINFKSGSIYFRALLTTSKKYRNQQLQRMNLLAKIFMYLNEYIEFPITNIPNMSFENPEYAAMSLREYWNLGDKPIENIVYLVEQNGIIVSTFDTDTNDIDAFSSLINIGNLERYIVAYSRNKNTAARIHFDIAHELGHILLHEWSEDVETLNKEEFKAREEEAHNFASSFLLPKDAFIKDIENYADNLPIYIELKKKWKVSVAAMIRRSYNLNLIDNTTYQNLMRNMQKKGIRKVEPLDDRLVTSKPSLLRSSINMLIEQNVLTPKEFINELSSDYRLSLESYEIENILDLPKDTLKVVNETPVHILTIRGNSI